MAGRAWTGAAALAIAMGVSFGAAAELRAAPAAGAICKSFTVSGVKYQWSVIGNVTCSRAKPWLLKILGDHIKQTGSVSLPHPPKGFHCRGTANSKGVPTAGACYTGTLAYPTNGFQWFG